MLTCRETTSHYKHDYFFDFNGKKYRVHSIVRLTEDGMNYLDSANREVILTEQFTRRDGTLCWKYEFKSIMYNVGIIDKCTDRTPDDLIEEIIEPASAEYASREIFGIESTEHTKVIKHVKKDWEITEVFTGWIILIFVFIFSFIFNDWYIRFIIQIIAGWVFGLYRQAYIDAYTTYTFDEDSKILSKKMEVLYGVKPNKEDKSIE